MAWDIEEGRPIYSQLVDRIKTDIISGKYKPGEKLPSVRDLAAEAAVNPNTMQRAFSELEGSGLIVTQRTNGRNVTDDTELIDIFRNRLALEEVKQFLLKMQKLGFSGEDAAGIVARNI